MVPKKNCIMADNVAHVHMIFQFNAVLQQHSTTPLQLHHSAHRVHVCVLCNSIIVFLLKKNTKYLVKYDGVSVSIR